MNNFEKNITFVIVSFRSGHIIEKCIQSINPDIKILIVENSDNTQVKNYLENKFLNVEVIVAQENLGYGKGNNLGISKVNTQYAFILNPDAILEENCLEELCKAQLLLKDDFVILAPNLLNNFGYFLNQSNNLKKEILEVDYVKGFAMLINLKKINLKELFDENFFLFLEEIDLCKRIKNNGGKIFVVQNSKIQHLGKQASENILNIFNEDDEVIVSLSQVSICGSYDLVFTILMTSGENCWYIDNVSSDFIIIWTLDENELEKRYELEKLKD